MKPFLVLMYHRISDILPRGEWVVSVESFNAQMEYLAKLSFKKQSQPDIVITFDDGYRDNYLNAYSVLKKFKFKAIVFLITKMIGTKSARERYRDNLRPDMLSWRDVTEMQESGIIFAPHTHTHPHLPKLTFTQQKREIKKSFDVLERKLGMRGYERIFSYPYGEHNKDTLKILRDLSVGMAFTVKEGINKKNTNFLKLRRVGISGFDNLSDFKRKLIC